MVFRFLPNIVSIGQNLNLLHFSNPSKLPIIVNAD